MLQHRLKAIKYNVSLREPSWNKRKLTAFFLKKKKKNDGYMEKGERESLRKIHNHKERQSSYNLTTKSISYNLTHLSLEWKKRERLLCILEQPLKRKKSQGQ